LNPYSLASTYFTNSWQLAKESWQLAVGSWQWVSTHHSRLTPHSSSRISWQKAVGKLNRSKAFATSFAKATEVKESYGGQRKLRRSDDMRGKKYLSPLRNILPEIGITITERQLEVVKGDKIA